jgi:hypothetical protein
MPAHGDQTVRAALAGRQRGTQAQGDGPIRVGANVQISADDPQTPHWEVLACTDPRGSGRMVLGSMVRSSGSAFHDVGVRGVNDARIHVDRWGSILAALDAGRRRSVSSRSEGRSELCV